MIFIEILFWNPKSVHMIWKWVGLFTTNLQPRVIGCIVPKATSETEWELEMTLIKVDLLKGFLGESRGQVEH